MLQQLKSNPAAGSPPQVRGKLRGTACCYEIRRITPAGAGKTSCICSLRFSLKDHPRRCGENFCFQTSISSVKGSPPQVRGKLLFSNIDFLRQRITPAGAGKTMQKRSVCIAPKDHPRRCGENLPKVKPSFSVAGSPPQVRGKLESFSGGGLAKRITPAGAGKTAFYRKV